MNLNSKSSYLVAAAVLGVGVAVATAAPSSAATANVNVVTGTGGTKRAEFRQNTDGSGFYFRTYGTDDCTTLTSDVDVQISDMGAWGGNWDNSASWAADYAHCDTALFRYTGFNAPLTNGYADFGPGGASLASINDLTSSYRLS